MFFLYSSRTQKFAGFYRCLNLSLFFAFREGRNEEPLGLGGGKEARKVRREGENKGEEGGRRRKEVSEGGREKARTFLACVSFFSVFISSTCSRCPFFGELAVVAP